MILRTQNILKSSVNNYNDTELKIKECYVIVDHEYEDNDRTRLRVFETPALAVDFYKTFIKGVCA